MKAVIIGTGLFTILDYRYHAPFHRTNRSSIDRQRFAADADSDPIIFFDADPDPDPTFIIEQFSV
jgi:hypothetical protein